MNCTQKQQLVCFPKVRVYKPWFRHFNDHKDFRNEGTVHLFSLMALFSYANFRSNERVIYGDRYMEAPGQWICKLGALPRILRVHSKAQALELMEYFQDHGFLTFEILDEEKEILRFTISDWKEHCTHLQYNYYSYKGSGFFFFPLPVGRLLLKIARKEVGIVFSELDAIMDMWLHTILKDPKVRGSEYPRRAEAHDRVRRWHFFRYSVSGPQHDQDGGSRLQEQLLHCHCNQELHWARSKRFFLHR